MVTNIINYFDKHVTIDFKVNDQSYIGLPDGYGNYVEFSIDHNYYFTYKYFSKSFYFFRNAFKLTVWFRFVVTFYYNF